MIKYELLDKRLTSLTAQVEEILNTLEQNSDDIEELGDKIDELTAKLGALE